MIYIFTQFKWRRGKTLSYGLMVPGSNPGSVTKYKLKKKMLISVTAEGSQHNNVFNVEYEHSLW